MTGIAESVSQGNNGLHVDVITFLFKKMNDLQEKVKHAKTATVANFPPVNLWKPPPHFPLLSLPLSNPSLAYAAKISISTTNPTIDLTMSNPPYAGTFYQVPDASHPLNIAPSYQTPPPTYINPITYPRPTYTNPATHQNPNIYTNLPPSQNTNTFQNLLAHSELGHYEETEKCWRAEQDRHYKEMECKVAEMLEQSARATCKATGLRYDDLCMHPDLDLLKGFKVPRFEMFNGTRNSKPHLRSYCDQLIRVKKNQALIMRQLSQRLTGEALERFTTQDLRQWITWENMAESFMKRFQFNIDTVLDRYYLKRVKQKPMENVREYVVQWRVEVALVQPPMSEDELTTAFIGVQNPEYYDRMLCIMGQKFSEIIKMGKALEDGFKTRKSQTVLHYELLAVTSWKFCIVVL
ncbi:uncharacterized protein LOC132603313 [Lycium barbarum]|uniref:uncharacterized protein LOC132603313 n=1 Tax=Lycium barbarum TaxID=112863 RepID=UPI00293E13D1|nr:uncharacterized protein LOC132603313 [Lycium barbarum]